MKKIVVVLALLLSIQIMPEAFAAKSKCTNQKLINLNQLAIDFNDNRANFLKYVVYANEANDGLVRTRRLGDVTNEAMYRESFSIATTNAKKTAENGKRIENQLRSALAQCVSGYGVSYSSDYGFLKMNKSIKGMKFPTYFIPSISVLPAAAQASPKPSPTSSTLTLVSGVNDKEFFAAQGERIIAANKAAGIKYKCIPNVDCKVGSIGPAGGIIFYDAGERKTWGRYLEVAPVWWDRNVVPMGFGYDPSLNWCVPKTEAIKVDAERIFNPTDGSLGSGPRNTQLLVDNCISGAGNSAKSYSGGGFSDWYLPTSQELSLLDEFTKTQRWSTWDALRTYFDDAKYWGSNCAHYGYGCGSIFATNFTFHERWTQNPLSKWEKEFGAVRPVRAF